MVEDNHLQNTNENENGLPTAKRISFSIQYKYALTCSLSPWLHPVRAMIDIQLLDDDGLEQRQAVHPAEMLQF